MSDVSTWPNDHLAKALRKAEEVLDWAVTEPGLKAIYEPLSRTSVMLHSLTELDYKQRPSRQFTRVMLMRARGAFYGAARLGLSGQLPEAYMVARGVLEASLFAFLVHRSPELEKTWWDRHNSNDPEAVKACRRAFTAEKAFKEMEKSGVGGPTLKQHLKDLYNDLIDYGGHPNVNSVTPYIREVSYIEESTSTEVQHGAFDFITSDPEVIHRCSHRVIQTGIGVLRLYQVMQPDLIRELDLTNHINEATDALWG